LNIELDGANEVNSLCSVGDLDGSIVILLISGNSGVNSELSECRTWTLRDNTRDNEIRATWSESNISGHIEALLWVIELTLIGSKCDSNSLSNTSNRGEIKWGEDDVLLGEFTITITLSITINVELHVEVTLRLPINVVNEIN
jgi:hypothetical protein